ncbi:hypothetical protein E1264_27330 [Actinomadura sp. KC216]|uniref:hypothetical protein n=1 Tax=Actinomadura sp. KC216 TaxID=2530370 RepID=UPI00105185C8|nr:hypothetical protein [Actinomadura sp. KC216]TDB83707.1 hypothetical protein E1264_27330 [Actinomadura sp. KC216]
MSGAKTVSVDPRAWREAQQAARQLAKVRRDMPRLLDSVQRQTRQDIDRAVAAVNRRQDQTEGRLQDLSEYTRDLEVRTSEQLREQAGRLAAVQDRTERLGDEIARERAQRRRQIADLDARVTDLAEGRDRATARAMAMFEDARTMAAAIRELPHERFAPGRLERLEQRLMQTAGTLGEQEPAFMLGLVQALYFDLSDLRVEVEDAELEWNRVRFAALEALRAADAAVESNARIPMHGVDGAELPGIVLDVDFWTDGDLIGFLDRLREEAGVVVAEDCPLTADELRAIAESTGSDCERRLTELLERAHVRALASQARANTAELAVAAFEQQGYELEEEVWEGQDFRGAHYSKLVSLAGNSEIVVEVAPDGDGGMAIKLLSYDADPAEDRRTRRTQTMLEMLRDSGVPVGAPQTRDTEPTPGEGDLKAIGERLRRVR